MLLNIKCVFWFSPRILSETFPFWHELSAMLSYMYTRLHVNCLLFLSNFNGTWIFSTHSVQTHNYQISWKSFKWEPSRTVGTDTTKLEVGFAILRTRIKTRVLATKPFHNNYSTNRGRHSNTKFITGPYELIFTFLNFGRRAVCRSVTLHLDISYGALHITGLTNKQAKRILG